MRWNNPKAPVVLLSALLLASCATTLQRPPADMMAACYVPVGDTTTNGGLSKYTRALKDALLGCNLQLDNLRRWAGE